MSHLRRQAGIFSAITAIELSFHKQKYTWWVSSPCAPVKLQTKHVLVHGTMCYVTYITGTMCYVTYITGTMCYVTYITGTMCYVIYHRYHVLCHIHHRYHVLCHIHHLHKSLTVCINYMWKLSRSHSRSPSLKKWPWKCLIASSSAISNRKLILHWLTIWLAEWLTDWLTD